MIVKLFLLQIFYIPKGSFYFIIFMNYVMIQERLNYPGHTQNERLSYNPLL